MLTRWSNLNRVLWPDFDQSLSLLNQFRRQVNDLFEGQGQWPNQTFFPRNRMAGNATVYDTGEAVMVRVELPGLSDKDIELTLNEEVLTLQASRQIEVPEGFRVHRRERESLTYSQSFTLPYPVDPEKTRATMADGVLTIELAKSPELKPRRIAVTAA